MDEQRICPSCRKPLAADVPMGLCPECLIKSGFPTGVETEGGSIAHPPFVPPAVEEIARLFPQLEILELVGQGGMGAVYKARQKQLNRFVALKILPPGIGHDAAFAERFTREARALAQLNHPGIVTLYEFGEASGQFYFLMEFVDGVNLRQLLAASRVSPREALAIVPQICDALQYAHDQGIVHRDIKPENILLDRRGRVKVADFGLAKLVGADNEPAADMGLAAGSPTLTDAGKVMGTPNYMSPEQMKNPGAVDHRADIYALGVVFYQMLTGELPDKQLQPPSTKVEIDVRLDEIVLRALEKKPERRYQQANALKTQIETIATPPENPGASNRNAKSNSRFTLAAIAVVVVAAAIIAVLALNHTRPVKSDYMGQTYFPLGDTIQITTVERNPNRMVVKGHYNLVSADEATLALNITSPNKTGFPEERSQSLQISKGEGDFELSRTHLVPGLPHVSMYNQRQSFAGVYFGTQDEAIEEKKMRLDNYETNIAPAAVETWSPAIAPSGITEWQKILDEAKDLMERGRYEESLQRYIWFHNHEPESGDSYLKIVRMGTGLTDWAELGRRYPKAREALMDFRDRGTYALISRKGYAALFTDVQAINHAMQFDDATYALFKTIREKDPQLAGQCYYWIEGLLVSKGEYQWLLDHMGGLESRFGSIRQSYEMEISNRKRMAETQQRSAQMILELNQKSGRTNMPAYTLPDNSAMMKKSAEDRFVGQVRQLIEIGVGAGHKADAEKVRDQALVIFDDERLKSAVGDAVKKIQKQSLSSNH